MASRRHECKKTRVLAQNHAELWILTEWIYLFLLVIQNWICILDYFQKLCTDLGWKSEDRQGIGFRLMVWHVGLYAHMWMILFLIVFWSFFSLRVVEYLVHGMTIDCTSFHPQGGGSSETGFRGFSKTKEAAVKNTTSYPGSKTHPFTLIIGNSCQRPSHNRIFKNVLIWLFFNVSRMSQHSTIGTILASFSLLSTGNLFVTLFSSGPKKVLKLQRRKCTSPLAANVISFCLDLSSVTRSCHLIFRSKPDHVCNIRACAWLC